MTGLLVSVRSAAEAAIALRAGADLIDVKEPRRGPLGRADRAVMAEVVGCVAGRVPVSAALGELRDVIRYGGEGTKKLAAIPAGLAFAKLGLAGCAAWIDWPDRWGAALRKLPMGITPVAVAYADWRPAAAPSPEEVLEQGTALGCGAALMDTHDKSRGRLFDHTGMAALADWVDQARRLGMLVVLAGSLHVDTIVRAAELGPDYVAVRGAACSGGRDGMLDAARVAALRSCLTHDVMGWRNQMDSPQRHRGHREKGGRVWI